MAFDLGLGFGLALGLVLGFEVGSEVGLLVSGCGCTCRLGVGSDVVVVDVPEADRRAGAGCGKVCRDGGGGRRESKGFGGAIGEEERVIVSGAAFPGGGFEEADALSLGGGLVVL